MVDREKVVKGLHCCSHTDGVICIYCPYNISDADCTALMAMDVLDLLKEREAKPMTEYDDGWDCPRCGLKLIGKTASGYPCNELDLPNDEIVKYCPVCGQEVIWNA